MDEKTSEALPAVKRGEGWKPRQQRKRTFLASTTEAQESSKEETPPKPLPLPFGKIDVFA